MVEINQNIDGITIKSDNSDNMHELIKKIKENTQILVDKYNVQDISVYIDESKSDILRDKKEVYVEVRM